MTLETKLTKQANLVSQLRMWQRVKEQDIDINEVLAFTWRDEFMTRAERVADSRIGYNLAPRLHTRYYNALRMKDGTLKALEHKIRKPWEPPVPLKNSN